MDRLALGEVISCLGTDPCDITLVVKDGKQFLAHGKVLSKASPFFERLLGSDMKESNEGVIRLHTIAESLMADILRFVYSGSILISSQEYAVNLLETADFLLLSNLKTLAEKFLEQRITTENCFSINHLAEQYSCEALMASTQKIIDSNFTTVTTSNEFLNLPSREVEKWVSSDEIVIDAEENVFEIILRWIDDDKSERSGKFSELFSHVRLTYLSRDYLLSHVLTNDLVKENEDCLDNVRGTLEWLDRPTDCDFPRSHSPRKALTINVIVIADYFGELQPCCYLPAKDEWYLLPANERQRLNTMKHNVSAIVSCRGKVFLITDDIARSQCYDPDSNRWSPAPWTNSLPFSTGKPLVVKNQIFFIVEEPADSTTLWTYSLDSNSLTPLHNWVERISFCVVAVDSYIYVIGGAARNSSDRSLSHCARFDTEKNEWQQIAPLNEARCDAFGVCKNEKIFIAGGSTSDGSEIVYLETCEVYNILRDEWQFMANLTLRRTWGSIMLVDETLYVLGGRTKMRYQSPGKFSNKVECYNHEGDAWYVNATVPINKIAYKKREQRDFICYFLKGCSLRVFKGVLTNLKSIA